MNNQFETKRLSRSLAHFEKELRERKCGACHQPCRNVRHPDTQDYDSSLPECSCCKVYETFDTGNM